MNPSRISDSSTQVRGGSADDRPHMVAPWVVADAVLRDLFVSTMLISPVLVRVRADERRRIESLVLDVDEVDLLLRRIGRGDGDDGDAASIRSASSALVEIERGMQRLAIELTRSGVTIADPDVEQHLADAARLFERANDAFTRAFLTYDPDPGSSAGR